jgi:Methane oxygenase PmoA
MKIRPFPVLFLLLVLTSACGSRSGIDHDQSITFIDQENDRKLEVLIDGKLFTSFCWPENVYKPILYPVISAGGAEVTRGFPLKPRAGERNDHIHQVGIWFNYGKVNGIDFWGNGYRGVKEPDGGFIKHSRIERIDSKKGEGSFISLENWISPSGQKLLTENSEYHFIARGTLRIIDRITTLTTGDTAVLFKDTKEGMFGIRVARQLELPSKEAVILINGQGNPLAEGDSLNAGVTGNYTSSEGITGDSVWGTRARWMKLTGMVGIEKISVIICDHHKNPGYPTYWHARGYGLFAANPLGWSDFTGGKEIFGFSIPPKNSAKFRFRVVINSGTYLKDNEINVLSDEFNKRY